ncbi:hypothetical protein EXIGLDRAFT_327424 [Exidia glandulosa HHB12029]|uniref:Polysaccharide lyase family 14 protein n=1 Tax=Exidia glandulosa HHB12029 TaxID=1314781 RepID=A0A165LNR5_EXIGL|nr:hypothetical protein EXIGLDRAFT_327424 [Exidia glandulosa HHB12029]
MRTAVLFLAAATALAWDGPSNTTTLVATSFEDGALAPFVACGSSGGSVNVTTGDAFSGEFKAASFGVGDGANLCLPRAEPFFHKEAWQGFAVFVPSSFPSDARTMIAQQLCSSTACGEDWCGALTLVGTNIVAQHRSSCTSTGAEITLATNIVRDVWHSVVVNVRMSNVYDGKYSAWFDGRRNYFASGINVGFDDAWNNGTMATGAFLRNGQSSSGAAVTRSFMSFSGLTRRTDTGRSSTLFFDDVSWYNVDDGASDGLATVMP